MEIAYTLYRVSTKQQVDKTKDDIPMQREACHEFAEKMGWTIGKEFLEKGVSGFKVSADNRDAIQDLKTAALNKEFDILLVFMFDRIGRIDDETPFIVEWFVKQGIRVWSVNEGEQRFESHVDKLMNYIRFWQASGESEKTSMRIKTRMQQLRAEGSYTGGPVPFGYTLVNTGRKNKRGKEVHDLAIEPVEAEWVRDIFLKTLREGYGSFRCADYLNKQGVKTHNGSKFQCNTIIRILKNRLYCGYMGSGETVSPQMKELQIIDEMTFERVQMILEQRAVTYDKKCEVARMTKTKLLLSGIMYCGSCGGAMTSMGHSETWKCKDGTKREAPRPRYVCYHKNRNLCECDGQTTYLAYKVDHIVTETVKKMFSSIKASPDEAVLKRNFDRDMRGCKAKITKIDHDLEREKKKLATLENEVAESLLGSSKYSPDLLNKLISQQTAVITQLETDKENIQAEMANKKKSMESVKPMYDIFKGWADEFDTCSLERKKMIISQLITRIELNRGYDVKLELDMNYKQFCEDWETITDTNKAKH